MTGSTANFPVCLWRSAPIPVLNDPAVGRRALLAMSEHSGARAAQTAGRAALGAWDGRSAGRGWPARGARAGCPMDRHGSPQADLVIDSDVDFKTITWALWEEHQFRCRNHQNRDQGKDHPMQNLRPTMRQDDPTQASPAPSAIAHRTLSTPHARATSCWVSTCRHRGR